MIDYIVPDLNKVHQYNCHQYNCSICDETFKSKNDFEEHTNVCQCASITDCCCSCHKEKSRRKKVKNYTIQTYKPHRFYEPQKDLDQHNNTHYKQEIDQYNCSNCDETFKSKNDFEDHSNVCQCASITDCCCSCQKEKSKSKKVKKYTQYNCSICDETFKSMNDFEEHTNVCQCASITDCCCSCQKEKSKRKKVKKYAIQTYKPHRLFKPQKDLGELNNINHIQENNNKHAGLTNWQNVSKCLLCGATDPHSHRPGVFRNRLEALEIVKGHNVVERKKPYKCGACEEISFLLYQELSQHINQTHIGMNSWKMYQCGICDKKFTGKKVLLDHLFDHNKPKYIECPICHIFISTKAILENHCKLVHDRKMEDFLRKIMLKEEGPDGEMFENDLPDVDYKG